MNHVQIAFSIKFAQHADIEAIRTIAIYVWSPSNSEVEWIVA